MSRSIAGGLWATSNITVTGFGVALEVLLSLVVMVEIGFVIAVESDAVV